MAHEFETGFFVSQPAWHGLGNVVDKAPSIAAAIELAGLDWYVDKTPLRYTHTVDNEEPTEKVLDSHFANIRSTDGQCVGVVGPEYTVLQNKEAFAWFEPLVESGDVTLEAAGSLREGKRIWVLGALKDAEIEIVPGDSVKSYVLLAHGHDGTLAIRAGFTSVRVVCQNTLSSAISEGEKLFKIRHKKGLHLALDAAREVFDLQRAQLRAQKEVFQQMYRTTCSDDMLVRYAREVLHEGAGTNLGIVVRNIPEIQAMFEAGRGAQFGRGTVWGAFNACTEFVTHSKGRSADARVDSNWFGPGAALLGRALMLAQKLCEKTL